MKALVYDGKLNYRTDYPMPVPGPGEVLLKIRLAGVCNTDREVLRGYRPDFSGILGHEFLAEVVEGSDLVGKRVVGELNEGCLACDYCKSGRESHCLERRVPGMSDRDGCFAEYMAYPLRLLHVVPDSLEDEAVILTEPLAAACEIPELNHLPLSEPVGVVGDGRLAFLIAQVLAIAGHEVVVFGRHEEKLKHFRAFAKTSLKPEGSFDTVVEASGHPSGLGDAIHLTKARGRIILKSTYAERMSLDMSEIVVRELTITGSRCGPFEPALRLLERGLIEIPPIERFALEDYEQALGSGAFKAVFQF